MRLLWRTQLIRAGIHLLIIVFTLVMQTAVFTVFPLWGVHPDLILLLVLSVGLLRGPGSAVAVAVTGGVLADVLTGQLIGLGTVLLAAIGTVAGRLGRRLVGERLFLCVLFSCVATAAYHSLYAAGAWAFGIAVPFAAVYTMLLPPLLLYNAAVVPVMHPVLARFYAFLDRTLAIPRLSVS